MREQWRENLKQEIYAAQMPACATSVAACPVQTFCPIYNKGDQQELSAILQDITWETDHGEEELRKQFKEIYHRLANCPLRLIVEGKRK